MKKIFQVAVMALVGVVGHNANAQESSLAVKAGVNFNSLSGENTDDVKSNIGFHAGLTYEMQLGEIFFVEPGVFFDTRGVKSSTDVPPKGKVEAKTNVYSVSIPVLAKVKFQVGDNMFAFFNAGPYANIGILGTIKTGSASKDIEFGDNGLKRLGFGLNFGAGVEVSRFIIGLGYDMGLTETEKDLKQKFTSYKIGIGYRF